MSANFFLTLVIKGITIFFRVKKEALFMAKKGSLSINSDNIFPIIKKWLYSDHDIFYRELISNGCDAITKLKKLELLPTRLHR